MIKTPTKTIHWDLFPNLPRFKNLKIRISNLFRASDFVFRIYLKASKIIIKLTKLTHFNIAAAPSAPML